MVEVARIAYVSFLHPFRISIFYALQDYVVTGLFVFYLILKISTNDSYSESTIQTGIGLAMAVFLGFIWGIILTAFCSTLFFLSSKF